MAKFRATETVDAIQWTGDVEAIFKFYIEKHPDDYADGVTIKHNDGRPDVLSVFGLRREQPESSFVLVEFIARRGDWIVRKDIGPAYNLEQYGERAFALAYAPYVR